MIQKNARQGEFALGYGSRDPLVKGKANPRQGDNEIRSYESRSSCRGRCVGSTARTRIRSYGFSSVVGYAVHGTAVARGMAQPGKLFADDGAK